MSIENPEEYLKNLWDWKILNDCFGESKIKVSDIDGFVERKGKVLILETKASGVVVPLGQTIAFDAFVKKNMTVFVIWGSPGCPQKLKIWPREAIDCDLEILQSYVKRWYNWANMAT